MAKVPVPFGNIESWTPGIDPRQTPGKVYVLEGRNFYFDSKGPKSGFGTRLLARGQIIGSVLGIAQSVTLSNRTFLCVPSGVFELQRDGSDWIERLDLSTFTLVPFLPEKRWSTATLAKGSFLCHINYGIQKLTFDGFEAITQENTPGLVYGPLAVTETNGRLIVLGRKYVEWSNANDPENFMPELGGAGSQLLSDIVPGEPIAVAGFQNGFLVWTTEACMLAEFIGGDNVFRFVRQTTKLLPLDANCVEDLPDGSQLILTKQGLHRIVNGGEPDRLVPLFNEFLRKELEHESKLQFRLNYDMENDHLWVQIRDWTNHYVRTYILTVSIDKWGEFNERHLGVIQWSPKRGSNGYVDAKGVAHKFVDHAHNRETTLHQFEGLDSEVTLGYVRPKELWPEIDALLEMQEINIGSHSARPSYEVPIYIDLGELEGVPSPAFIIDFVNDYYEMNGIERSLEDLLDTGFIDMDDLIPGVGFNAGFFSNSQLHATAELLATAKQMTEAVAGFAISFEMSYSTNRQGEFAAGGYLMRMENETPGDEAVLEAWDSNGYMQVDLPNFDNWFYDITEETGIGFGDDEWRIIGNNKMVFSMKPEQVDGDRVIGLTINGAPEFHGTSTYDEDFLENIKTATKLSFVLYERDDFVTKRPDFGVTGDAGLNQGASGYIRKIIGYSDGDFTKNVERSTLTYPRILAIATATSVWSAAAATCSVVIPGSMASQDRALLWIHHRQPLTAIDGWSLVHTIEYRGNGHPPADPGEEDWTEQKVSVYTRVLVADDSGDTVNIEQSVPAPLGATLGIFRKQAGGTPAIVWESITETFRYDYPSLNGMRVDESYPDKHWGRLGLLAFAWNPFVEWNITEEREINTQYPGFEESYVVDNATGGDTDFEAVGDAGPKEFWRLAVQKREFGGDHQFYWIKKTPPDDQNSNFDVKIDSPIAPGVQQWSVATNFGVSQIVLG